MMKIEAKLHQLDEMLDCICGVPLGSSPTTPPTSSPSLGTYTLILKHAINIFYSDLSTSCVTISYIDRYLKGGESVFNYVHFDCD